MLTKPAYIGRLKLLKEDLMSKYDLHVHTYFSDGLHSPGVVIDRAIEKGLDGIAITDHDTVLGIEEAILYTDTKDGFNIIPGIEFSCIHDNNEVHILGYFNNYRDKELICASNMLRKHRVVRVEKIIEKLNSLSIGINFESIREKNDNDFVGRVAVARELISKGYVTTIQEAFNRYLNPGRPAYVERYKLSIDQAIELIKGASGIAVLAHPGLLKDGKLINVCIDKGIDGIECIHSKHTVKQSNYFKSIAANHNLIETGGSDCHGEIINGEYLIGRYFVDLDTIPKMKEMI